MNNHIQLKKTRASFVSKNFQKRAVAPVIATLLLVAIAVVGGSIIFVFSQDFFATAQISGSPQIESVKILGYDATDRDSVQYHDGFLTTVAAISGNVTSDGLNSNDYVGVYLKNDSVNKVTLSEIRVAGDIYAYVDFAGVALPASVKSACAVTAGLDCSEYTLVEVGEGLTFEGVTINSSAPSLEPGQHATLIFALEKDVKSGRDMQFKLSTSSGAVFVSNIQSGQQNG